MSERLDSVGIGELVRSYTHLDAQGDRLKFRPRVRDVIEATHLDSVIRRFDTEGGALASF